MDKNDTAKACRALLRALVRRNKDLLLVTVSEFAELGLAERLLRALKDAKYVTPTPIQQRTIPP